MNKLFLHRLFSARLAYCVALVLSGVSCETQARDYFNPEFLGVDNPTMKGADLSGFEDDIQAPGNYRVDVIVNDQMVDTREIEFKAINNNEQQELAPCLSVALLNSFGVKTELFPELGKGNECANLAAIPSASYEFLFNTQKLLISIPQAALSPKARGYMPPERWDEGINAALLNYSFSGDQTSGSDSGDTDSQYANLRPGLNLGAWRLRNYTTWNRDSNGQDRWDTVYTYAQRNIISLKSQMTLGDSSSPADVFDSVPFRGGQLASDDEMLPDSLKGYAPVVRGIARTNAQVTIRQNGYIIYQSYVAPGAFEITDMFPTGGSGDLDVTIKEADGSEQHSVVPFASLPVLQREGRLKYSLTGGQYRSYDGSVDKTPFAQGTGIYGLPHGFTLYGGVQESSHYQSLAAGVGKNMGDIGAFSTDVTQAWSTPQDMAKRNGQSWRIRYSKNFVDSGTNFAIAGYRYSTAGYYSLQEVLDSYGDSSALQERRRNRMELTVSQTLGAAFGALSLSAIKEDYWSQNKSMESYSAGYNNSWKGVSWGMNYTWSKNSTASGTGSSGKMYDKDQVFALNVSVPLDKFMAGTWANYNMSSSKQGSTSHMVGMNGVALQNNALSWGVQEGYATKGQGNTGNLNADYKGTYGEVNAGYGYNKDSQRVNYGVSGGILAHEDGVTFSQPLGETIGLVKAPGAKGVSVQSQQGVKTDWRGYTVATSLTPYRENSLTLDTQTLPDDVELDLTTQTVVPTRGAVVRAEYKANIGARALITIRQANGEAVPFGATVKFADNGSAEGFIVGDGGQAYITGLPPQTTLKVEWGEGVGEQCVLPVSLPADQSTGVIQLNVTCKNN
ncbi:fimbria/pilus outer membrane usher protein [Dryocola clanedunensis]